MCQHIQQVHEDAGVSWRGGGRLPKFPNFGPKIFFSDVVEVSAMPAWNYISYVLRWWIWGAAATQLIVIIWSGGNRRSLRIWRTIEMKTLVRIVVLLLLKRCHYGFWIIQYYLKCWWYYYFCMKTSLKFRKIFEFFD